VGPCKKCCGKRSINPMGDYQEGINSRLGIMSSNICQELANTIVN